MDLARPWQPPDLQHIGVRRGCRSILPDANHAESSVGRPGHFFSDVLVRPSRLEHGQPDSQTADPDHQRLAVPLLWLGLHECENKVSSGKAHDVRELGSLVKRPLQNVVFEA